MTARHKVTFLQSFLSTDAAGGQVEAWAETHTRWAMVDFGGKPTKARDAQTGGYDCAVSLNYDGDMGEIKKGMRLQVKSIIGGINYDRTYRIDGITFKGLNNLSNVIFGCMEVK